MVKRTQRKTKQRKTLRKTKQRKTQRKTKQRKTQRKTKQRKTQRKTKQRKTQKRKTYKLKGGVTEYILGYFILEDLDETNLIYSEFKVSYDYNPALDSDLNRIIVNLLFTDNDPLFNLFRTSMSIEQFKKSFISEISETSTIYKYKNNLVSNTYKKLTNNFINNPKGLYDNIEKIEELLKSTARITGPLIQSKIQFTKTHAELEKIVEKNLSQPVMKIKIIELEQKMKEKEAAAAKEAIYQTAQIAAAQAQRDAYDIKHGTVTLDRSDGKKMGINLMKNPVTGKAAVVRKVVPGGQAEQTRKIEKGMVVTHINGTDVRTMSMKDMTPIVNSSPYVKFRFTAAPEEYDSEEEV